MNTTSTSAVDSKLVAANNDFGFRLLAQLIKQENDRNIFISPSSIAIALTMAYSGAEGATKQAMAETLGVKEMSLQEVNEANAKLLAALENIDPQVQLAIANSLWAGKVIIFKPDFIQRSRDFYGAEVTNLDFTAPDALSTINGWVKRKTKGKIDNLVKSEDLHDAILLLINAIYFKGIWKVQFDREKTKQGVFTLLNGRKKQVPMMSQSGRYKYYKGQNFQAISLPYGEGRLSMYIFLPDKTISLSGFQKSLNSKRWREWLSLFSDMEGDIIMPRFKLESEADLNNALVALGMGMAFYPADFEGMCVGSQWISKVRHKTFVEVNEEGTEATASTAIAMVKSISIIPKRFVMVVDRAFFCAIQDNKTDAVLFMGYVVEPV